MKTINLDFSGIESLGALHKYLKKELFLPEYYGENPDALYDCLTGDIELPVKISIANFPLLEKKIGKDAKSIFQVFLDSAKETGKIEITQI